MATKGKGGLLGALDWRLATYFLPVPIVLLYVLAMVGCISKSPGVTNVFLFKLQNGNGAAAASPAASPAASELRVGHLGMCAGIQKDLVCLSSSGFSAEQMAVRSNEESAKSSAGAGDLTPLLPAALKLQARTFLCVLVISGIFFCLALTALALLKRDIKKQARGTGKSHERRWKCATLALLWASTALATISAAAVTQATSAMVILMNNLPAAAATVTAGVTLQALQWAVVVLLTLFALGISVMIKSGGGKSLLKLDLPAPVTAAPMSSALPKAGAAGAGQAASKPVL